MTKEEGGGRNVEERRKGPAEGRRLRPLELHLGDILAPCTQVNKVQ